MTTIAFRDGILATDSLITSGHERAGLRRKAGRVGPLLYASTGSSGYCNTWEAWLLGGMKGPQPHMGVGDNSASAFVFMPDGLIVWFHREGSESLRAPYWASGSGGPFAAGAMATGASAEEAVACAIAHDVYSGGPIQTYRIDD